MSLLGAIPVTDAPTFTGWSEQDRELFNAYPFFLTKIQVERKSYYTTYNKMVKTRKWTPNHGPIMRGVRLNPSPHLRQEFMPDIIKNLPRKDVIDLRETTVDANIRRHRFESQMFNWFPAFNDFWPHLQEHGKDILAKIERAEDLFLRTAMFHCSPFAFVIQENGAVELRSTIPWDGTGTFNSATQGKTTAVRLDLANRATGVLNMKALLNMATIMETELGIPFFKGSELPKDDQPLDGKYLFITSAEAYNKLSFDPTWLQYKSADHDVIRKGFSGPIQGRITCRLESLPLRLKDTGAFAAPEARVGDNNNLDLGETQPSSEYATIDGSPVEVGFICGPAGYESLEVGPPPKDFAKDEMPHNFPAMQWNGQVKLTKQFLTEYVNEDTGEVEKDIDAYGESLKYISQVAFGVLPTQRRNVIPVFYKRARM
jgi:hypothetical protein